MWANATFTLFYEVYWVLVRSVRATFIEFCSINLMDVANRLESENFVRMLICFLSSVACTNCFGKSKVTFSMKLFSNKKVSLVLHTIMSFIRESWRLSNSHSELIFLNWKLWHSYRQQKNLWQRMVAIFLYLQYYENLRRTELIWFYCQIQR